MKAVATSAIASARASATSCSPRKRRAVAPTPKAYMKQVVDNFNLSKWLGAEGVRAKLAMAGYRGPQAEVAFLFARLVAPIGLFFVTASPTFS
jgi:tight adherence protein C